MRLSKRIISIMLVFLLTFTGENIIVISNVLKYNSYAATTLGSNIAYDNFSQTDGLQINGANLIVDGAIQFESTAIGESIFTSEKTTLGSDNSFSTSFTFKNISPSELNANTEGGFAFVLQPIKNDLTSNNLDDEILKNNFSIGFKSKYSGGPVVARGINQKGLLVASISNVYLSSTSNLSWEHYYSPYMDELQDIRINGHLAGPETTNSFNVWIGYDGTSKKLETLILNDLGEYEYFIADRDLSVSNDVYAGFMGSMGNAGDIFEIGQWHFASDTSLIDDILLELDYDNMILGEEPIEVNSNFYLSSDGDYGSNISWESSDTSAIDIETSAIDIEGIVTTPGLGEGPKEVTLTATISRGKAGPLSKSFNYLVTTSDRDVLDGDLLWLDYKELLKMNYDKDIIFSDLSLPMEGKYGSYISWTSNNIDYLNASGEVTKPSLTDGDQSVTLTATISRGGLIENKEFDFTIIAELNDTDIVSYGLAWLRQEMIELNGDLRNVTTDLNLPSEGIHESSIEWETSDKTTIDIDGKIKRPSYGEEDKDVTLTATISYGSESIDDYYYISVKAMAQSDEGKLEDDLSWLSEEVILSSNVDLDNIVKDLNLPSLGEKGSTIRWESSDEGTVNLNGIVSRPAYPLEDKSVTLTANLVNGSASGVKTFSIIVKTMEATENDIIENDSIWLDEELILNGNSSLDNIMTDLYLPTEGQHGSTITWNSSNRSVIENNGKVNRPSYLDGDPNITLTATIEFGIYNTRKIFDLKVRAIAQTDESKLQEDYNSLNKEEILADNPELNNITSGLYLPSNGNNGSQITWTSSNPNFVSDDGMVIRPIFIQGDQTVELRADLTLEEHKLSKTFTLIVKVGYLSDELTVDNDLGFLDEQKIKNDNMDLNNVESDLNLPLRGDYGSFISWQSSDTGYINLDGKVTRPKFTEEEKSVTLTALVKFNSVEKTKVFTLTVKPLVASDEEIVEADALWLEEVILKDNSGLDNIMTDLYLPSEGKYTSSIEWFSSHPEFIDLDGRVSRPSHGQGDKKDISLVATIVKDSKTMVKEFLVTVKNQALTSREKLQQDLDWLDLHKSYILNANESDFSVRGDLLFPKNPPNLSLITWESDSSEIISNTGQVNRPENGQGHKLVTIKATLSQDSESETRLFKYTVLEIEEGYPPIVVSTNPIDKGKDVPWDTKEVEIVFDENIIGANGFGILIFNGQYVIGDIYENTLSFSSEALFRNGENRLVIPASTVKDKSGNLNQEYEITFTMEEKAKRTINIINTSPANLYDKLAYTNTSISIKFDETNLIEASAFERILFKSKNYLPHEKGVSIGATLDKDTLNIRVNESLHQGTVYELVIPQGLVKDRYENTNKETTLQFKTIGLASPASIKSLYPKDNQFNLSINQDIEIVFSGPELLYTNLLVLKDDTGKVYNNFRVRNPLRGDKSRYSISLDLEPNKGYSLSGPYNIQGSEDLGFEINFRTGNNSLPLAKTYPLPYAIDYAINGDIIIEFDTESSLSKATYYVNSSIIDSNGERVIFQEKLEGNKVILSPLNDLEPDTTYRVHIPAGEFKNIDNQTNDDYSFTFITAKPLEVDSSLMDLSDRWFIDKELEIGGSSLEYYFFRNGRSILSYEWDLGDGSQENTKKFTHKYYIDEDYRIALKIKDDKGFEYELEDYLRIESISEVHMAVEEGQRSYTTNDALVIEYKIVLEQNGQLIPGESLRVDLYKDGGLQRSYDVTDSINNKANYIFTFVEEKGIYAGIYELVFTHDSHGQTTVVKEYLNIPGEVKSYPFEFNIYDNATGQFFSDSYNLYVKLNGERYKATRTDAHITYYTVRDQEDNVVMLQHGVRYYLEVEGWKITTKNFSKTYDKQLGFSGQPLVPMSKDKAEILDIKVEFPLDYPMDNIYIEGAKINEANVSIQGVWNDLTPGYYEMKSEKGDIFKTFKADTFKINPSEVLEYGNDLMFRMVADNGIKSPWKYAYIFVAPQPQIKGKKLNVSVVNRQYRLSYPTVFDGVMGGAIDVLKDIPLIDGGNFGIGDGMPAFSGPVYLNYFDAVEAGMDFEAGLKYDTNKKNTKDTKIPKVKKVTSVGYSFDFKIDGELLTNYYYGEDNWDLPFAYVLMSGSASRKQSSGYKLFGIIGIEAYFTMGVRASGALNLADNTSKSDYSGNITLSPVINGGASGNYGLGEIGGFIELSLPVTIFFPTNIIDVEANIEAKIENVFIGHKEVLLNKKYNAYKWTNRSRSLMRTLLEDDDTIYIESTLLPRDYVAKGSNWVANDMAMMRSLATSESEISRKTFLENVYPYTELQLVESMGKSWLIWLDDNANRSAINRTQLKYSVLKDGQWSEPKWIDDDGSADFTPRVTPMGDGVLMAWHNTGKVLEDDELEASIYSSEISVSQDIFTPESSPRIVTLTDDDKLDHSPRIASNNENALVVWTKSEGLSISLNKENTLLAPKNTDSLLFSEWKDGSWAEAKEIANSLPTVVDSSLYMNDREGLLLYVLDLDNDFSTMEDREIFTRIYSDGIWEDPIKITDNNLIDTNPQALYLNNNWFITWLEDGNIKYMEMLNGEKKGSSFTDNMQNNYQLVEGKGLLALVYRSIDEEGQQQIGASFYDINEKTWGDEVLLTEEGAYSRVFNASFNESGDLSIAYGESKLIKEVVPYGIEGEENLVEEINISDKVDLKTLNYTPINDLAINPDDIYLSSEIPLPGTRATVYANVRNEGDFAEKARLELYDGDPNAGGTKLGENQMTDFIPARSSKELAIDWLVEAKDEAKYDLYLLVSSTKPENDSSNNMASIEVITTDLAILDTKVNHSYKDEYSIEVLLKNEGARKLDRVQLILEDESGNPITSQDVGALDILESQYVIFTISTKGLSRNQAGEIKIYGKAESSFMEEANLDNNTFELTLISEKLQVDSINISNGESNIAVEEKISIGFTMDIDEGNSFADIVLMDDFLNKVAIETNIEDSILTLAPVDSLEYDTNYTLEVPSRAIENENGEGLNSNFRLTFTTGEKDSVDQKDPPIEPEEPEEPAEPEDPIDEIQDVIELKLQSLPYIAKANENVNGLNVYRKDEKGNLTLVKASFYDPLTKSMMFYAETESEYVVKYIDINFRDTDMWAKDYIIYLAARGIVEGVGNNKFEPERNITRAEFVKLIVSILEDLNLQKYTSTFFNDVNSNDWYSSYIGWAVENKVVTGYGNGNFGPNDPITREQMAVMLSNFARAIGLEFTSINKELKFKDQGQISNWALDAIKSIQKAGIVIGDGTGNYKPKGLARRAESAKVVAELLKLWSIK